MVWSLTRFNTGAEEKIPTSAVPAFTPSISKGLSGRAVLFSTVAVFQP